MIVLEVFGLVFFSCLLLWLFFLCLVLDWKATLFLIGMALAVIGTLSFFSACSSVHLGHPDKVNDSFRVEPQRPCDKIEQLEINLGRKKVGKAYFLTFPIHGDKGEQGQ